MVGKGESGLVAGQKNARRTPEERQKNARRTQKNPEEPRRTQKEKNTSTSPPANPTLIGVCREVTKN
jgi:hypothetical protein